MRPCTPSRPTFLLCDAAYLIAPMRGQRLPGVLWDGDAMLASWDRIEAIEAATGARLIATHELDYETAVPKPPGVVMPSQGRPAFFRIFFACRA